MRIVLDTNVFISGIFWEGNFCSQIIELWKTKKFDLVSSIPLIEELTKTLESFKIQMDNKTIEEWKKLIIKNSQITEPIEKINIIKEDFDDNKFIETAISGDASYIISQDKHLLNLKEYNKIKIISPEEFIKIIGVI